MVLFAPVSDGTVVQHAAQTHYGTLATLWIRTFYTSPGAVDLCSAIRDAEVPILLLLPETDDYFPAEEQAELREVAHASGHTIAVHPGDHQTLVLRAWGFSVGTDGDGFSGQRSPELLQTELDFMQAHGSWKEP